MQEAKNKISELEKQLESQKAFNEKAEAARRGSMTEYSDKMFQKLLDAEAQFDREHKELNEQIQTLKNELQIEKLKNSERENADDGLALDNSEISERVSKGLMNQMSHLEAKNKDLTTKLQSLEKQLKANDLEKENVERERRGSIKAYSDSMMKKLLDAEAEFEQKVTDFETQIKDLRKELRLEQAKSESLKEKYSQTETAAKVSFFVYIVAMLFECSVM